MQKRICHGCPSTGIATLAAHQRQGATFVARDDCLVMPAGWQILVAEDPLLDQREQHASKWTTRTPHGIVHMWGTPMGRD